MIKIRQPIITDNRHHRLLPISLKDLTDKKIDGKLFLYKKNKAIARIGAGLFFDGYNGFANSTLKKKDLIRTLIMNHIRIKYRVRLKNNILDREVQ